MQITDYLLCTTFILVAPRGIEPRSSEPKSGVIPIYYRAIQTVFNMSMNNYIINIVKKS